MRPSQIYLVASLVGAASAFAPMPRSTMTASTSTTLYEVSAERIKKSGGGIPLQPAGNNHLFDPALQGKIGDTTVRVSKGNAFYLPAEAPPASTTNIPTSDLKDAQHWMEDMPLQTNTYKPSAPGTATVIGRRKLIRDDAPGDIEHVVLMLPSDYKYQEGQSISVIPPGVDAKSGKPHKPRLYSIASTRYGDLRNGQTVSLCVRRAEYVDPTTGQADPTKAGVCSNFLCDVEVGDQVKVAGPIGKTMLLPSVEELTQKPDQDLIMVATGTGVAPFRAFVHRLFLENTVARHLYTGEAWLILGVPTTGGLLYAKEFSQAQKQGGLRLDYAISREQTNRQGGRRYVQDVLDEQAEELFSKLDSGAIIYFCGLKGMMPGILATLEEVATRLGRDWSSTLAQWKSQGQWHVEVY